MFYTKYARNQKDDRGSYLNRGNMLGEETSYSVTKSVSIKNGRNEKLEFYKSDIRTKQDLLCCFYSVILMLGFAMLCFGEFLISGLLGMFSGILFCSVLAFKLELLNRVRRLISGCLVVVLGIIIGIFVSPGIAEASEDEIPRYYFEDVDKESLYEGNMVECFAGYQVYMPADWKYIPADLLLAVLDTEDILDGTSFCMMNPELTGGIVGGWCDPQDYMDGTLILGDFKIGEMDAYMNDIPVIYQNDAENDVAFICYYINDNTLGWFVAEPASDENIRKTFGVAVRSFCESETASWNLQNSASSLSNENEIDYYAAYQPILDEACAVYGDVGYCSYSLYDIDKDGIKELITSVGTCTADWTNNIYTIDGDGNASVLGQFGREVTLYEADDGNGIYTVWGFQGCQEVTRITKEGSECYQETILANEIAPGEDYISYPNQISSNLIDDSSLLSEKVSEGETQYSDQRKLEKPKGDAIK